MNHQILHNSETDSKFNNLSMESVIYHFNSISGGSPNPGLIQAKDGNLYGTTNLGGDFGTIFRINPATNVESVIYTFRGCGDGGNPRSGLIQASDGNLYVTTENGGNSGLGAVFRINPTTNYVSLIYSFTGKSDGAKPQSSLIQASDGNLYGTTSLGGYDNFGTIFRINPATNAESVVYSFSGLDGANPAANLIQASDGDLYGTTKFGGKNSLGTVFKINPTTRLESVIYSFTLNSDGVYPTSGLTQASDGNLYGATEDGGNKNYFGTVFRINFATGSESVIYRFQGWGDGANPKSGLIQASNGSLYLTTKFGGNNGLGAVIRINPATGSASLIYSFTENPDGANPVGLIQLSDGNLYGTTESGGTGNLGTVFRIINNNVANPKAGLIQALDGNLYGTTRRGSISDFGTIFRINPVTDLESEIYFFKKESDGIDPNIGLIQASDGNLYGTTTAGGVGNVGTVFRINPNTGLESVVYSFAGNPDGDYPMAGLIQASDGYLYGTTEGGGTNGLGTIFRIDPTSDLESVIYSFTQHFDGSNPVAGLIQASDNNLYGTTEGGGTNDLGTIFKIDPTSGLESVVYSFKGSDGDSPRAGLIQALDGNLYGTTYFGGIDEHGTIFKINPANGLESVLYRFTGGSDGANLEAGLMQTSNGNLYGTTYFGGLNNMGAIFVINPTTASYALIHVFAGNPDGAKPQAGLIKASDGNFYGITESGGSKDLGAVFRANPTTNSESVIYNFSFKLGN